MIYRTNYRIFQKHRIYRKYRSNPSPAQEKNILRETRAERKKRAIRGSEEQHKIVTGGVIVDIQ